MKIAIGIILAIYNAIRLSIYVRRKMSAKSEKQKNILKIDGDNTDITFFPNAPYVSSCDPNAQIPIKPHFAEKWFTKDDLTVRVKIKQ